MRLFEEYFQRHKIDVPVAHHCLAGSLVLHTVPEKWNCRWAILSIKWVDDPYHPGKYVIQLSTPIHNSQDGNYFEDRPEIIKKWHQYEDFILDWCHIAQGIPAQNFREATLITWEMFVYSHDRWFQEHSDLQAGLFDSLDNENPKRYESYQNVAMMLSKQYPAVFERWKKEFLAKIQYYSEWLVRLITQRGV